MDFGFILVVFISSKNSKFISNIFTSTNYNSSRLYFPLKINRSISNKYSFIIAQIWYLLLLFIRCIFIHPTELSIAVLAHYISHHVTARQHDPLLDIAECKIHHTFEEISSSYRQTGQQMYWRNSNAKDDNYNWVITHTVGGKTEPQKTNTIRTILHTMRNYLYVWHTITSNKKRKMMEHKVQKQIRGNWTYRWLL